MISAVIVNYRTPDLLRGCLRTLDGWSDVVVVDNASGDGSAEMVRSEFPSVNLVEAGENRGFGAGANLGIEAASSDLVLLLNPDTRLAPETGRALEEFFAAHPVAGAVGCGLVDADGMPLVSARRFYTPAVVLLRRLSPGADLVRNFELADLPHGRPCRADWIAGSGMALRREAFEGAGGFDERFFLYFEDVDLCLRLWLGGWEVWHLPEATLAHYERRASVKSGRHLAWHMKSWVKFGRKWAGLGRPHFADRPENRPEQNEYAPAGSTEAGSDAGGAPLRVAFEASAVLGPRTGIGRYLENLVAALWATNEAEPVLVAISLRRTAAVHRYRLVAKTRAVRFPARLMQSIWDRGGLPAAEAFSGPVDVFHGPNFFVPPTRQAARVLTIHDIGFVRHPEMHTASQHAIGARLPASIERADRIITVSEFVRDEVAEWAKVDPARIDVVYHGVRRLPSEGPLPEGLPSEYLLYAGTLETRKGAAQLLEAYRRAAADEPGMLPLVIAGGIGLGGAEAIEAAARAGLDRERLLVLGYVDDAVLGALFDQATVFVFPSQYEGFGLPPLEAMYARVPVIATDAGALAEVLGDAALLVPNLDDDALAGAIIKVASDSTLRSQMAEAGRAHAKGFTWEATAEATLACYGRAIEEAGRTRPRSRSRAPGRTRPVRRTSSPEGTDAGPAGGPRTHEKAAAQT